MLKKHPLWLIFAIAFLDVVAANGLGPLLADYVINLPAKPIMLTAGTALMLSIQLAFSPAIGYWSDQRGRRPAAIATTIASFSSTLLLLPLQTWGYITNRCLKGATNGLYAVLRSSVADLTQKDELLRYAGLMSFVVGSGTILGPMSAGWLMLLFSEARLSPLPIVGLLLAVGALNIGLAVSFRETNPDQDEVKPKQVVQKGLNALKIVTLWRELADADQQQPGFKALFILNILATLGMGYYAFFVAFLTQSSLLMTPRETVQFFLFFGGLALVANLVFFQFVVHRVNKRKVIIGLAGLSVVLQVLYSFSADSVTLLYVVAGVDAVTVSMLTGITGSLLSVMVKEGGCQGEMFGNIQGLGGVATFTTALMNSLLSGVSLQAPFFFGALSMAGVVVWALRLPPASRAFTDVRSTYEIEPVPAGAAT